MANLTPSLRPGVPGLPRHTSSDDTPRDAFVGVDDELRAEMQRLSAANADLMRNLRGQIEEPSADEMTADDVTVLRAENAALRRRLEEVEQLVAGGGGDQAWAERQSEYEVLLEEKSEVIRALHQKIQEVQESGSPQVQAAAPAEEELEEIRRQLEEERRQVQEDEETLMSQMRAMELAMSRERAELARQRAELQRMHSDLTREVEQASRDSGLRERLLALTRRQQDSVKGKPAPSTNASNPPPTQPAPAKQSSGFFRRIFGG